MIIELHGSAAMRLQRQDAGIPSHLLGKRPIFDPNFLIKRVDSSDGNVGEFFRSR